MLKSFAAATMASYTAAQSAIVTEYSVSTGAIQNAARTADVATTSLSMVYQELVNGVNSYTVMNQTYSMTLATGTTWTTDAGVMVQMVVCYPYTSGSTTTVNSCNFVEVTTLQGNPGPTYVYLLYPSVAEVPVFGSAQSLYTQMEAASSRSCNLEYNGTT